MLKNLLFFEDLTFFWLCNIVNNHYFNILEENNFSWESPGKLFFKPCIHLDTAVRNYLWLCRVNYGENSLINSVLRFEIRKFILIEKGQYKFKVVIK